MRKHWLGILLVITFAIWCAVFATGHAKDAPWAALPFFFTAACWVLRGFFRMVGRAFRHGATKTTP